MRRIKFALSSGLAAVALSAPGQAQTPPAGPEFYAVIAVAGFERPVEVRVSGPRKRVDVATGGIVQSYLTDRARGSLVVMTAAGRRRVALVFPISAEEGASALPLDAAQIRRTARTSRIGSGNAGGRACALFRYTGYHGRSGTFCEGPEGVVLQFTPEGRQTPLFRVERLTFARQDARWFVPPPDYQVASLPGIGGIAPARPAAPAPAAPAPAPKR